MDYGFTDLEALDIYMHYKKLLTTSELAKRSGIVKGNSKEIAIYKAIVEKILAKHPTFERLPY